MGHTDENRALKIDIERLGTVDSTNSELKRRIIGLRLVDPIVLTAQRQTGGLGRRDRAWLNSDGAVLMSAAVPLKGLEPNDYPLVAMRQGWLYAMH